MSESHHTGKFIDEKKINYGGLMHKAMRGLVAAVVSSVSKIGLPGDHHFFITFGTSEPGVIVPPWLQSQYPDEMTIVIQNYYQNLQCDGEAIYVTLNFDDRDEDIVVPIRAIKTFVDPSVEFGLKFEQTEKDEETS